MYRKSAGVYQRRETENGCRNTRVDLLHVLRAPQGRSIDRSPHSAAEREVVIVSRGASGIGLSVRVMGLNVLDAEMNL